MKSFQELYFEKAEIRINPFEDVEARRERYLKENIFQKSKLVLY